MVEYKDDVSRPSLFDSPGETDLDWSDSSTVVSWGVSISDKHPEHPTRDYSAWLQEQLEGSLASDPLLRSARHVKAAGKAVVDFEAAFCDMERGSVGEPGSNLPSNSIAEVGDLLGLHEQDIAIYPEAFKQIGPFATLERLIATCKQREDRSCSGLELEGASAADARSRTLPDAKDMEVKSEGRQMLWDETSLNADTAYPYADLVIEDDLLSLTRGQIGKKISSRPILAGSPAMKIRETFKKVKRGLSGYMNGLKTSALPDTGASRNTVTLAYAQRHNLHIKPSQNTFTLGNQQTMISIGKSSFRLHCSVGGH